MPRPPGSTLFPYTTLFRSDLPLAEDGLVLGGRHPLPAVADVALRLVALVLGEPPAVHLGAAERSEEHTSELQSQSNLVCRLLLEKKNERESPSLPLTVVGA